MIRSFCFKQKIIYLYNVIRFIGSILTCIKEGKNGLKHITADMPVKFKQIYQLNQINEPLE